MPQFSANLGFLWQDRPLPDRIIAAAQSGFSAVECHFPYDTDADLVSSALQQCGLPMLGINTVAGNPANGEFGLCAVADKKREAVAAIDQAISYADRIGARNVHVMAGLSGDAPEAMSCFRDNLQYASRQAAAHDIGILIEPINRIDKPGYTLHLTAQAIRLIEELEDEHQISNVKLMFDCYHVQMSEGNLIRRLQNALPHIGHIQVAAVPGRGEPTNCEINYPWLFAQIDQMGYDGFIGAEYVPATSTDAGLGWFSAYRK